MAAPPEDAADYDARTTDQIRYDAMSDQVREAAASVTDLAKIVRELAANPGNSQTIYHRTEGMGTVGVICATVCVMCVVVLILGAVIFVPDIHDLRAWQDIMRKDIARLQAGQEKAH